MGKVKIKKNDVWIDMTPMSDVMVLLLTFFMLTSTFVKNEAVKVVTPNSVSEIKVPEENVLTVLVDKTGKIFLGMDTPAKMETALTGVAAQFGVSLTSAQLKTARAATNIGVPMQDMQEFLNLEDKDLNNYQQKKGVPTDSIKGGMSEFQTWVQQARNDNGADMKIAIKADENTPYKVIKKVMSELQDMNENRYYLITAYKIQQED
ncbi:MAG: biopolymer transporter ExbD [Prevotellaceae bacterium]|nr:biopolymer transporter ExbD [Prevotella sp.]MDD7257002.1 biopolymer transporter ExbD [Prevotellaceae bacterium]MDY6130263.1 biopolymer transporter ExbD [Prevotella sp.]